MIEMVNEKRVEAGLPPLKANVELREAAAIRSVEIVELWGHVRPDGTDLTDLLAELEFRWTACTENICMGPVYNDNRQGAPVAAFDALWNSQGHKANMMSKYTTDIAIAIYYCYNEAAEQDYVYVAQIFAKPW